MIGVFDSGLGGLTILKALIKHLPKYNYVYLGDSARAPYGNKTEDVIFGYAKEAVDFLFSHGCCLIIFACNTASAKALRRIQQEYLPLKYPGKKVLGVLVPAAEATIDYIKTKEGGKNKKRVGIIATTATINSGTYEKEIKKLDPKVEVFSQAAPLLVSIVEKDQIKKPQTKKTLELYLQPLKRKNIQALILGCTHYPFLEKQIREIIGDQVYVINTPEAVAGRLKDYLKRHPEIKNKLKTDKKIKFYTTDNLRCFKRRGEKFLGAKIKEVKEVKL